MPPSVLVEANSILNGQVTPGSLVNVIGIVEDFRQPIATSGADYKASIRFYDESIQHDDTLLTINIFRGKDKMPDPKVGDVLFVLQAKVQYFRSEWSLITHIRTDMHVFAASDIPTPPSSASNALRAPLANKTLTKAEFKHVSVFYHGVDKERLPAADEFEDKLAQSLHVKQKFSLIKDIVCHRFADLIAEVVTQPCDVGDRINLWVSDYTEHPNLPNYPLKALPSDDKSGRDCNYTTGQVGDWTGPYGKRSLHISCFEPHTEAIRSEKISARSWVLIRNVQIKYGRNCNNLEGFLRSDNNHINISLLNPYQDGDSIDPRLKETLRRRREYESRLRKELAMLRDAAKAGQKRRASLKDEPQPPSERPSKAKRKKERESRAAAKSPAISDSHPESESQAPPKTANACPPKIKCENDQQPISTVTELLAPVHFETRVGAEAVKLPLPFINANYRAHVRVKDYLPHRLEDFAYAQMEKGLYGALKDDDDDDDAAPGSFEDDGANAMGNFVNSRKLDCWEWRFYLQLEDAGAEAAAGQRDCVWVKVDNHAAQCLLDMNAGDLANSKALVSQLREKLFHLWGNLEDLKSERLRRREQAAAAAKKARENGRPPPDSDDDDADAATVNKSPPSDKPFNRAFACCVKQYGVKMRERDPAKADAGPGRRWQRMYGLFGTKIAGG